MRVRRKIAAVIDAVVQQSAGVLAMDFDEVA
jgi:hypothetical protein